MTSIILVPCYLCSPCYHCYLVTTVTLLPLLPCYHCYLVISVRLVTTVTLLPLLPCYHCYLVTTVTLLSLLPCYHCYLVTTVTLLLLLPCYHRYLVTSVTLLPPLPCYFCYLVISVTLLPLLPRYHCYLVTSVTLLLCYLVIPVTLLPLLPYYRCDFYYLGTLLPLFALLPLLPCYHWKAILQENNLGKTLIEMENLRKHIDNGCLSGLEPGEGTECNESLHHTLNNSLVAGVTTIGPELIVALLSLLFYGVNSKRKGIQHKGNSRVIPFVPVLNSNEEVQQARKKHVPYFKSECMEKMTLSRAVCGNHKAPAMIRVRVIRVT